MASSIINRDNVRSIKKALSAHFPDDKSAHLSEALAAACGFKTHAAFLASMRGLESEPIPRFLDDEAFCKRLGGLSGVFFSENDFSFEELVLAAPLYSTLAIGSDDAAAYSDPKAKAWRTLCVAAVNEGLRRQVFSLSTNSGPAPGRACGAIAYEAALPDGRKLLCSVADIGFSELSVRVSLPSDDGEGVDVFACCHFERETAAFIQTPESFSINTFRCKDDMLPGLAALDEAPIGYSDRGAI